MDRFPQMLFKAGGSEQMHGGSFTTRIVHDEDGLAEALADGWHETTPAALAALQQPAKTDDDTKPPTREELEQKAVELGVKFDGRTTDRKLAEAIAAKLAEKA